MGDRTVPANEIRKGQTAIYLYVRAGQSNNSMKTFSCIARAPLTAHQPGPDSWWVKPGAHRRDERGMAVIVVLALVAIILIYLAANLKTLLTLDRELKLLETKQTHRLLAATPQHPAAVSTAAIKALPAPLASASRQPDQPSAH